MDDVTQTKRNLDGIYFRVQRDGKWGKCLFLRPNTRRNGKSNGK